MTITLPTAPLPREQVAPRLMGYGRTTQPLFGGAIQPITRLGSRYAIDVAFPALDEDCARAWIGARLASKTTGERVKWSWPQPAFAGGLGAPLVKGGGQAGSVLNIDGAAAAASFAPASFFSFTTSSRVWLHAVHTTTAADGSGEASLPISPMLRVSPADNATLNFAAPEIEGYFAGEDVDWTLEQLCVFGLRFTLYENR